MAKTIHHRFLGGPATPQDIKDLRSQSFDFHETLGYPVILKHRWTLKDFQEGLVERCPLHDDLYGSDPAWDQICFGTGYVGGFRDAEIMYVSLSDAPTDTIKITPQGLLQFDHHPQLTAPWIPYLQDGDMIVIADFDEDSWEVEDLGDRYILKTVNQVTVRGPGYVQKRAPRNALGKPFIVHQETTVDKLPYDHPLYQVPLIFDYSKVEPDITPPDEDPNEPSPTVGTYSATERTMKIRGNDPDLGSEVEREIWVDVEGEITLNERTIRVDGEGEGVEFHW